MSRILNSVSVIAFFHLLVQRQTNDILYNSYYFVERIIKGKPLKPTLP